MGGAAAARRRVLASWWRGAGPRSSPARNDHGSAGCDLSRSAARGRSVVQVHDPKPRDIPRKLRNPGLYEAPCVSLTRRLALADPRVPVRSTFAQRAEMPDRRCQRVTVESRELVDRLQYEHVAGHAISPFALATRCVLAAAQSVPRGSEPRQQDPALTTIVPADITAASRWVGHAAFAELRDLGMSTDATTPTGRHTSLGYGPTTTSSGTRAFAPSPP